MWESECKNESLTEYSCHVDLLLNYVQEYIEQQAKCVEEYILATTKPQNWMSPLQ
jgi:hypothetical protein